MEQIWHRLQLAFESQLGALLIILLAALALLTVAYWVLALRQKKRDRLAYEYRQHFGDAEGQLSKIRFVSTHRADLFGRITLAQDEQLAFGQVLIPPPGLLSKEGVDRFIRLNRALGTVQIPGYTRYTQVHTSKGFACFQVGLLDDEGNREISLREVLADRLIADGEKERFLLELVRALNTLHTIRGEGGDHYYHGMLLPRSICVEFDANRSFRSLVIADVGFAFAMGAQQIYQLLEKLHKGTLTIDHFAAAEILDEMSGLAPEQRKESRLKEVGQGTDFYAFGAIAIALFTGAKFVQLDEVKWEKVPLRWHRFLRGCLQDLPERRPKDFMELEDWLSDPELDLAALEEGQEKEINDLRSSDLSESLEKLQQQVIRSDVDAGSWLEKGERAIELGRWSAGLQAFEQAEKENPESIDVLVGLAICAYEKGDLDRAEKLYRKVKEQDPKAARRFRQHLTFKI